MAVRKRLVREKKRKYKNKTNIESGMAWYKPGQWEALKRLSADGDEIENTYMEWIEYVQKKMKEFEAEGVKFKKVAVDVGELLAWCNENNLPMTGKSRSSFVAHKLYEQDKKSKKGK